MRWKFFVGIAVIFILIQTENENVHEDELGISFESSHGLSVSIQTEDELGVSLQSDGGCSSIQTDNELGTSITSGLGTSAPDTSFASGLYTSYASDGSSIQTDNELGTSITSGLGASAPDTSFASGLYTSYASDGSSIQMSTESDNGFGIDMADEQTDMFQTSEILGMATGDFCPNKSSTPLKVQFGQIIADPKPQRSLSESIAVAVSCGKTMMRRALSMDSIKKLSEQKCHCGQECFKKSSVKEIFDARRSYWSRSQYLRTQWLIDALNMATKCGRFKYLQLHKTSYCTKAFLEILMINKNTLSSANKLNERNSQTTGGTCPRKCTSTTLRTINWLEEYANFYGDRMPNSPDVLLPYKFAKRQVFRHYKLDMHNKFQKEASETQFYRIWATRFPHMKARKTNAFTKCNTCYSLERHLEISTCPKIRAEISLKKDQHNERQMSERRYYYAKRDKSRNDPENYMSVIIDGMDQSKSNLPHFAGRKSKSINPMDLLKTHITGVINHGHGGFHTYVDYNQYQHDPNLTINIILQVLKRTSDKQGHRLPATLYLQADNCFRENKNKFVLAFLQLLVEERIFNDIQLSFLYVGHTHEDVDSAFSSISRKLKVNDVETLPELVKILPACEMLQELVDVKSWLIPSINNVNGISKPLHFKICRVSDIVKTFFKGCFSDTWIECENNALNAMPVGTPSSLLENYEKIDTDRHVKQINLIRPFFKKEDSYETWEKFYTDLERTTQMKEWVLEDLPRQTYPGEETVLVLPENIHMLLTKETTQPMVTIRKLKTAKTSRSTAQKRKSQEPEKKTKQKRKKIRKTTLQGKTLVIILDDDTKRHVWMKIMIDLFCSFFLTFGYLIIMVLILFGNIYLLLQLLAEQWTIMIKEHTGHFAIKKALYMFLVQLPQICALCQLSYCDCALSLVSVNN